MPKSVSKPKNSNSVLFVFYKPSPGSTPQWKPQLPKGWTWVGNGQTRTREFPFEAQYAGPKETRTATRQRLQSALEKLKHRGSVERFKIRNSYLP